MWEWIRFNQFMLNGPPMVPWDELPEKSKTVFRMSVDAFVEDLLRSRAMR
jgi:hypothetical protein